MQVNQNNDRTSRNAWKASHYGVGFCLLIVGFLSGRVFFPAEVSKPIIVEREKRVEIPVERIVERKVPVEVVKYVDRVVEKRVEVPVVRLVEKLVEVPVERIVYRDRVVEKSVPSAPAGLSAWRRITKGLSRDQVRAILGSPKKIETIGFEVWYYGTQFYFGSPASVHFSSNGVNGWSEP